MLTTRAEFLSRALTPASAPPPLRSTHIGIDYRGQFSGGGGRGRAIAIRSRAPHKKKLTICASLCNYHIMSYSYVGLEAAYEAFAGRDEPDLILCPVEHAIWLFYACWGFVPDGYLPPSGPGFSCQ